MDSITVTLAAASVSLAQASKTLAEASKLVAEACKVYAPASNPMHYPYGRDFGPSTDHQNSAYAASGLSNLCRHHVNHELPPSFCQASPYQCHPRFYSAAPELPRGPPPNYPAPDLDNDNHLSWKYSYEEQRWMPSYADSGSVTCPPSSVYYGAENSTQHDYGAHARGWGTHFPAGPNGGPDWGDGENNGGWSEDDEYYGESPTGWRNGSEHGEDGPDGHRANEVGSCWAVQNKYDDNQSCANDYDNSWGDRNLNGWSDVESWHQQDQTSDNGGIGSEHGALYDSDGWDTCEDELTSPEFYLCDDSQYGCWDDSELVSNSVPAW